MRFSRSEAADDRGAAPQESPLKLLEVGEKGVLLIDISAPTSPRSWGLTPAEETITRGVFAGWSNSRIATERGVSVKTVANQVNRILSKAGVASRWELVAALAHRGDDG